MISATSLSSASSPHSLTKSAQISLGLENGRLRMDSQKFLVPSLPVSARALNNDPSNKRRERSIVNGIAHPSDNHHDSNHINGLRRSYSGSQLHQHQLHTSPRKDAQSPHYNGESNGCNGMPSNPSNFSVRSSVPIPCSSPSPGSSASPNKPHSPPSIPSPNSTSGSYAPQLPPNLSDININSPAAAAAAAAAAASRLYPGGFHGLANHPAAAAHLGTYYAAAAAAATHSLPYPMFGAHSYSPHSGSSYLDNYHHSNLLAVPQMRTSSASPPRSQPTYMSSSQTQQHQQQQHSPHLHGPHTTSTTSLHNQLIESVGSGERFNGHNHNHLNNHIQHHHTQSHNSRYGPGGSVVTKHSPSNSFNGVSSVGMGNLPPPPIPHAKIVQSHEGSESISDTSMSMSRSRSWAESTSSAKHSPSAIEHVSYSSIDPEGDVKLYPKDSSYRRHMLPRSPEDLTTCGSKNKNLQFSIPANDPHTPSVGDYSAKLNNHANSNNSNNPFLLPSPKKRSGQWNFSAPHNSSSSKPDLPPPLSLPPTHSSAISTTDSSSSSSKYLSNQSKSPSNNTLTNNSSCNSMIQSPKSPYLMTPPVSSAQNFHFQFPNLKSVTSVSSNSSNHSPKTKSGNNSPAVLSGPTTPTTPSYQGLGKSSMFSSHPGNTISSNSKLNNPPVPIEQLPLIDAFQRGSLTQLPNGDLKRVEDLSVEDFLTAAEFLSGSISIINCTVISIHLDINNSICKVILTMGSHNQQVIVETSAEQPFYVIGRGWSSSAPAKTEERLQLRCTPLCVGDVCITLRRNLPAMAAPASAAAPVSSSSKSSKSTSSTNKGTNHSNTTHNSSPKTKVSGGGTPGHVTSKGSSSARLNNSASNSRSNRRANNNNGGSNKGSGGSAVTSAMLPPPTPPPPVPPPPPTSATHPHQQKQQQMSRPVNKRSSPPMPDENNQPTCPKKRRWSAPEAISDDSELPLKALV